MATLVLALVLVMQGDGKAKPKAAKPAPPPVLVPIPGYIVMEGDEVRLYRAGARGRPMDVPVAGNWAAFRDLQKAGLAGDLEGFDELLAEDYVALVPSGTRVRVLRRPFRAPPERTLSPDPEYRDVEVRMLDGPKAGKAVVVAYEHVRACRVVQPKAKGKARRR